MTAQEPSGCTDRGVACLTHFWSERRPTRLGTSNKCPRDPQSTFPEQEQLRDQNQSNPLFSGFFGMIPLLGCRFLSSHTHTSSQEQNIGGRVGCLQGRRTLLPQPRITMCTQEPIFWCFNHQSDTPLVDVRVPVFGPRRCEAGLRWEPPTWWIPSLAPTVVILRRKMKGVVFDAS